MLLVGASLLVTSFYALRGQDLGFKPDRVIAAEIALSSPAYKSIQQIPARCSGRFVTRLRAIPGVEAASGVYLRPLWSHVGNYVGYVLEGQRLEDATDNPIANEEAALPGDFDTMFIWVGHRPRFHRANDNAAGVPRRHRQREPARAGRGRTRTPSAGGCDSAAAR